MVVFDTNILIDYLNGEIQAKQEIEKHNQIAISIITYIEVMAGVKTIDKVAVESFLSGFQVFNFDKNMTDSIVEIRNMLKIKLPDAIILATARANKAVLVTRNSKDFLHNGKDIIIPYQL